MSSVDQPPPALYAPREPIFPRRVYGTFRSLKWVLMAVLLGIYYITPWIRWDRGPNLPDQAVLIDMSGRRFFFFMIEIWPHEFYFVAGLLIMAGLGLFLFTSAAGRVWCGYACPQTVWTDLFILVERWIEGDRGARIRLHRQPWNWEKLLKNGVKWWAWLAIALATGGAWIFYFTDAPTLFYDLIHFQAHPIAYITMGVLTGTTFFFGGFAREQICIYACPWPRIQAAMMDEDTLTIGYRDWRGEPRGKLEKAGQGADGNGAQTHGAQTLGAKAHGAQAHGDCIDCMACVNVCPQGIDIRDGQQLACITCGLCIDACNGVMDKIGRPRDLIGYLALTDEVAERAGAPKKSLWRHILRVRTVIYTVLWAGVGVGLIVALFLRAPLDVNVTPIRNPQYVTLSDGSIRNAYDLRLRNMQGDDRVFNISATSIATFLLAFDGQADLNITVPANQTKTVRLFVTAPLETLAAGAERSDLRLWIMDMGPNGTAVDPLRIHYDSVFYGAEKRRDDDDGKEN